MEAAAPAAGGVLRGATRRCRRAGRILAGATAVWLVATLAGGLPSALALDWLARRLPGGSADLAGEGGAVLLDALVQGRGVLTWTFSTAAGVALTFALVVEPFLRGALLCAFGECHCRCAARRGLAFRGGRHLVAMCLLKLAVWTALALAAAALLLAGLAPVVVLPALWIAGGLVHDVLAAELVTEGTIGTALRRGVELLRRRPLAVLAGGLALRLAALAPLAGLVAALSAGPGGSGLRPVVLLSLPAATLLVRWWWLALVVEIAAERPRGAPDRA